MVHYAESLNFEEECKGKNGLMGVIADDTYTNHQHRLSNFYQCVVLHSKSSTSVKKIKDRWIVSVTLR